MLLCTPRNCWKCVVLFNFYPNHPLLPGQAPRLCGTILPQIEKCRKLATQHRVLLLGRFLSCCDDLDHDAVSICLLAKASLFYSNSHIQYIFTNNPLARKQANSITSLHSQQRVYLMARFITPVYSDHLYAFQSLIISESSFDKTKLISPSPTEKELFSGAEDSKSPFMNLLMNEHK